MRNLLFATLTLLVVIFFASCTKNSLVDTISTPNTVVTTPDTTHTDGDSTDVDNDQNDGDHNDGDSTDVNDNDGNHDDGDSTDVDGNDGNHDMDGDSTDVDNDNDNDDNNNDNDDDDNNGINEIPANIQSWIDANFAGAEIGDVEIKALCDGTIIIEVEVNQGSVETDLIFTDDGNLIYTEIKTPFTDLPTAVKSAIVTLFPNGEIDEDATFLQASSGANLYEVDVKDGDTEWEVTVGADGSIICKKEE
jgi:Putative beta-lactamase-inhibitor-like, PepSY-like